MKRAPVQTTNESAAVTPASCLEMAERLRVRLLNGRTIRAIDAVKHDRPAFWAALTQLRDELPIIERWETLGERHLAGTRLRTRVFLIPDSVRKGLTGGGDHV